jgi:hypothetical protein
MHLTLPEESEQLASAVKLTTNEPESTSMDADRGLAVNQ